MMSKANPRRWTKTAGLVLGLSSIAAVGCQGDRSTDTPVHLLSNMDNQDRYDAQEGNEHFANGAAMRQLVKGTVARGKLRADDHLHRGKSKDGKLVETLPKEIPLTAELIDRGEDRYNIYCAPCHDGAGTGDGIIVQRGMLKPPAFTDERVLSEPLGHLYTVVTNGVRNMPAYKSQIPVEDRWAVVAYVRTLQRAQYAQLENVPQNVVKEKGWR